MPTITDRKGNILAEEPDTLEDWRQAAQVEAGIRKEFQIENERLRALLREGLLAARFDDWRERVAAALSNR